MTERPLTPPEPDRERDWDRELDDHKQRKVDEGVCIGWLCNNSALPESSYCSICEVNHD